MITDLPNDWQEIMTTELDKPYFKKLSSNIKQKHKTAIIFPPETQVFTAFSLSQWNNLRVVILGQDPYHGSGQAIGLSFSVPNGITIPPSLQNIFKEIEDDVGVKIPNNGNLERWAHQGVLLLNSILTVESGKAGSHQKIGWEQFTDAVIKKISDEKDNVVFLLWGNFAQTKIKLIDQEKHLVLTAPHPSPLAAYRGFFGCRHFSQTNIYLEKNGLSQIIW